MTSQKQNSSFLKSLEFMLGLNPTIFFQVTMMSFHEVKADTIKKNSKWSLTTSDVIQYVFLTYEQTLIFYINISMTFQIIMFLLWIFYGLSFKFQICIECI